MGSHTPTNSAVKSAINSAVMLHIQMPAPAEPVVDVRRMSSIVDHAALVPTSPMNVNAVRNFHQCSFMPRK